MALETYKAKRDFKKTAEPPPKAARSKGKPIFVVQEHHATRLHWDFRLEADGVLKSWAVPKEPTLDPSVKRLAVQVEDHPLQYATFHGDIPKGEYGGGHVEIWDNGTWELTGEKEVRAALDAGKLEFRLRGKKLNGGFALVRMRGGRWGGGNGKDNWLLMKRNDEEAKATSPDEGKKGSRRLPRRGTGAAPLSAPSKEQGRGARATKDRGRRSDGRSAAKAGAKVEPPEVAFTHEERVMFPEVGITKGDVLRYYEQVADKLLPHLRNRPVTLERLPDGLVGEKPLHFWQKNTPSYYPDWISRIDLPNEAGKPVQYAVVNDRQTLLYLVNQGTITFHPYFSRVDSLDTPDFVLFDIDPHQSTFASAVKVVKAIHDALKAEKVQSFVKTTGKSGLHVMVPWQRDGGYDEARAWAMKIAEGVVKELPKIATVERSIAARGDKVYVDVMQNAKGHHAVPPYVLRATPEATVSTPLDWKELTAKLNPKKFAMKAALARFKKQEADPMREVRGSG